MRTTSVLLAAFLAAGLGPRVEAHAFLDHAKPAVGSKIDRSPHAVRLWFTEPLEPAFSTARVENSERQQVDKRKAHVDSHDKSLLVVPVPRLPPGTYTVIWRVVSTDTHRTEGHFTFTIKPGP